MKTAGPFDERGVFADASFASLGIDAAGGPHTTSVLGSGDTITLSFGPDSVPPIPLPGGLPLLAGALCLLAALRRR